VRLRTSLLLLWSRRWLEGKRLERRRRVLLSRLGEAVYRGDAAAADAARGELAEIDGRLDAQRRELASRIEETQRREQEAAVASRRTAVITQEAPDPGEPSPHPGAPPEPVDPVPTPGPVVPAPARVPEPFPPPDEADPPRLPDSGQQAGEAPASERAARRPRRGATDATRTPKATTSRRRSR
jgi:hypothetical protein